MHPLDQVLALPAFTDNYIWTWQEDGVAFVVDPGDAGPVLAYLSDNHLTLGGILVTHHHPDHVHGIGRLRETYPQVPVYGPANSPFEASTHPLSDGDTFRIGSQEFRIIATPGHTLDHICYFHPQALFCGDTLFAGGCGRLFEGTAEQMHRSLQTLAELPAETPVYCTHEYTLANLTFAAAARPQHAATLQRLAQVRTLRQDNRITLPTSIGDERQTNPFLCVDDAALQAGLIAQGRDAADPVSTFTSLRRWKDEFRG